MKTYLNIATARKDGKPDNSVLAIVTALNRHGFLIEGACVQTHIMDTPVVITHVNPPLQYRRILPRLAKDLACHIVLSLEPGEPPKSRAWLVTQGGLFPLAHND